MPFKKYLILILFLFFASIVQGSFLTHFTMWGASLNVVFISVFLLNFLEEEKEKFGIFAGFLGGIFLDFYSIAPFGIFTLVLGMSSFLIKKSLGMLQKSNFFSFLTVFFPSFFFYRFSSFYLSGMINFVFHKDFRFFLNLSLTSLFLESSYNFFFASLFLFLLKKYAAEKK